jgi:3-deoxy-D-manno-octulosonate 8-phosphate phosphatase (KDO 8-P phosphatase)
MLMLELINLLIGIMVIMNKVNSNNIELIIYDFDGVMTNNKAYIDKNGNELVQVNRSDGLAVSEIKKLGIHQVIISTEKNTVVSSRARKLDIPCLQDIQNKKMVLINYCKENNIDINNVAFVGNDVNDLEAMKTSGYSFCPSDAHKDIISISHYVLKAKGGEGTVREIYDIIKENR